MIKPSIEFLTKDRSKPYFITYAPINPHHPYNIPEKKYNITGQISKGLSKKKKSWFKYLDTLYYADSVLAELIHELQQAGLLENTLFFLFADHGEAFYQHRQNYNHAFLIYEENVAVPFLIYNKKFFKKPYIHSGISRHVDILPTVLDILNIPAKRKHEGLSLFSAHKEHLALLHTFWGIKDHLGLRDGRWKYICRMNDMFEELYDIPTDPGEKNNLASHYPAIVKRYRAFITRARIYKRLYFKNILKK